MIPEYLFMQRAFMLALNGINDVSPNPLVGCVIVHENTIIGEGWHQKYGHAHAEVNALQSVVQFSVLPQSTLYVNLEPCSHTGKTPPCAELIIQKKIKKVVISNIDTNPLVSGCGIATLQQAGVEIQTGILAKEGRELNKRFFTYVEKKRPYIILKWAQTADGFIAPEDYTAQWISNTYSRQLVHQWRSQEAAILVGTRTALYDNPRLNVREWSGRNPIRIVIDRYLKLPSHLHLFDRSQKTICYNLVKEEHDQSISWVRLGHSGFIKNLVADLFQKNIQSIIVEGGMQTLQSFINANLWDEARIFYTPHYFKKGILAPSITGNITNRESVFSDTLIQIKPCDTP